MTRPNLSAVLESIERAHKMVSDLCHRRREWIMSIPARPDYDPDIVIGTGLRDAQKALLGLHTLTPVEEYHEDIGDVIWHHWPLEEYPIIGGGPGAGAQTRFGEPTDCQELHDRGWLTHFSPLPDSAALRVKEAVGDSPKGGS